MSVQSVPTVFVIDSDSEDREFLGQVFRTDSIRVEPFESAEAFIITVTDRPVGCILTELELPGTSGLALLAEVRRRGWATPTITITKSNRVSDCSKAFRHGAADYFLKPILAPQPLVDRIRECFKLEGKAVEHEAKVSDMRAKIDSLTRRETKIATQLLAGMEMKDIARESDRTLQAVSRIRLSMLSKLGFVNEVALLKWLMENDVEDRLT